MPEHLPDPAHANIPTVIAEIFDKQKDGAVGEKIGIVKIGDRNCPLIFEPLERTGEEVSKRAQTIWHLLHYLNKRLKQGGCIDDINDATPHIVSFPLKPETLEILHRVIHQIGVGRIHIHWILGEAVRDGRILQIPVVNQKKTEETN